MNVSDFKKLPILGIMRGIEDKDVEPLTEATIKSGLKTVEITMNTDGAAKLISKMVKCADGELTIGAGTVLTESLLGQALDAGATFIVMPVFIPEVVSYCVKNNIPNFPGAFTPQEIFNAWQSGATMVKVFPSKFVGPAYMKEVKGPFNNIELLACGGVGPDNIKEFLSSGASAVAFGESIFKKDLLRKKEFGKISKLISELIDGISG